MSLSQVTITFISTPPSTTSTVSIPLPSSLTTLDSGQTVGALTGFQGFDTLVASIAKRGGFTYTNSSNVLVFVPKEMIVSIAGQ